MAVRIITGHVLERLAGLPAESVHCVVTSPPYYGLRDYGIEPQVWGGAAGCEHEWVTERIPARHSDDGIGGKSTQAQSQRLPTERGFCRRCGAWRGSLGLEPTLALYLDHMVEVMRAVRRVLRADGTCWLNVGDSYSNDGKWGGSSGGKHVPALHGKTGVGRMKQTTGLKPKDLMLVPARLAIRLQDDGWWVRSDIAWCKRAPMPESCQDRPTTAWEHVFLLTRSAKYFYDAEAVKEECEPAQGGRARAALRGESPYAGADYKDYHEGRTGRHQSYQPPNRNMRNVWHLGPEPLPEAHFATFPTEIPRRAILAGTSAKGCCAKCGAGWVRVTENTRKGYLADGNRLAADHRNVSSSSALRGNGRDAWVETETLGWRPSCGCRQPQPGVGLGGDLIPDPVPCTVLDPFLGSGTTALVGDRLGRHCIGIELNEAYAAMARRRLADDAGMFAEVAE